MSTEAHPISAAQEAVAPEPLLEGIDPDQRVEIINGALVEMSPVGFLHHIIAGNIFTLLNEFVRANRLGYVMMDGLLYLMHKTSGLRGALVPDVSYISKASLPAEWDQHKPFPGAPTLAVEVISPDETALKINQKLKIYLEAGTAEVWIVYPEAEEVYQYRADAMDTIRVYRGEATIPCAPLEGLAITAAQCFAQPKLD
ncbi:MAG: Uma2 family endonuclease [Chloroflexi bacterium CFX4]|nr:Uma2 family endonuclease [Chloroflexi bacterium CFX4]MDL1922529.1 Uma2 family endonuclease [Chloroflexi bacterium CFX3]